MRHVDEETATRLRVRFGPVIESWLADIDARVSVLAQQWSLSVGPPAGGGNTSLVLRCLSHGRAAVLKLVPVRELAAAEAAGLTAWSATGAVPALLAHDEAAGASLLDAIVDAPGSPHLATPRRDHDPDAASVLVRTLHSVAAPPNLQTLAERLEELTPILRRRRALPARWSDALELAADPVEPVLLHGDLHLRNVLVDAAGRLTAIDPRPCSGDPCWDAIELPVQAADLGLDPERLSRWRHVWSR